MMTVMAYAQLSEWRAKAGRPIPLEGPPCARKTCRIRQRRQNRRGTQVPRAAVRPRHGDQQRPRRGLNEAKTFFGLSLDTQRDMLLFLVEEHLARQILEEIARAGEFESKPGSASRFRSTSGCGRCHWPVAKLHELVEEEI